jgi:hypothetical protein
MMSMRGVKYPAKAEYQSFLRVTTASAMSLPRAPRPTPAPDFKCRGMVNQVADGRNRPFLSGMVGL